MSSVTHTVYFATRIGKLCDKAACRYSLANVQSRPRKGGGAWHTATDGRAMAVVADGNSVVPTTVLVPDTVTAGVTAKKCVTATLNGQWQSSNGKFAPETSGSYPQAHLVFPDIQESDAPYCTFVRFDAKLLATLAEALSRPGDEQFVTLIVKPDTDKWGYAVSAITVQGKDGIGVLMPVSIKEDRQATLANYIATRDAYKADCGK